MQLESYFTAVIHWVSTFDQEYNKIGVIVHCSVVYGAVSILQ